MRTIPFFDKSRYFRAVDERGFSATLREALSIISSGGVEIIAIDCSAIKNQQMVLPELISEQIREYENGFCEIRKGRKAENLFWHIHAIRDKYRPDMTCKDLKLDTSAFTVNVSFNGSSTEFTPVDNIFYEDIDVDPNLESFPNQCCAGNLLGSFILDESLIFSPPCNTVMIFKDHIVHKAPLNSENRDYLIASNYQFSEIYNPKNDFHIPLPDVFFNRLKSPLK